MTVTWRLCGLCSWYDVDDDFIFNSIFSLVHLLLQCSAAASSTSYAISFLFHLFFSNFTICRTHLAFTIDGHGSYNPCAYIFITFPFSGYSCVSCEFYCMLCIFVANDHNLFHSKAEIYSPLFFTLALPIRYHFLSHSLYIFNIHVLWCIASSSLIVWGGFWVIHIN